MYAILSDIHGNMFALEEVAEDMKKFDIEGIFLLGDLIDYGMQSNEVVDYIRSNWNDKIICNIWGNHERAILIEDYSKFSSQRGVDCAKYTASKLKDETRDYLSLELIHEGVQELLIENKKILAVHGSLDDHYWKAVLPDDVRGNYAEYDIVLSGHSHYSHCFSKFYNVEDPSMRNKHAVLFINPGSVGQPRNHNPFAQYVLLDLVSQSVCMRMVKYNVNAAMSLYSEEIDVFYKDRLARGV